MRVSPAALRRFLAAGAALAPAVAVRGITVLLDGTPLPLPGGQGQRTSVELGEADHIEVLRGASSAPFGNAAGGVISIWSDPVPPGHAVTTIRATGGGRGRGLDYAGRRQHSAADFRNPNTHLALPLAPGWALTAPLDAGQPTAVRSLDRLVTPSDPDDSGNRLMRAASGSAARAADAATVYANVGTSFETPTTEMANCPDTAGGFNPTLAPQTATQYEVGMRGEPIAFGVRSSPGRSLYRNAGRSRHRGRYFEPAPGRTLALGS